MCIVSYLFILSAIGVLPEKPTDSTTGKDTRAQHATLRKAQQGLAWYSITVAFSPSRQGVSLNLEPGKRSASPRERDLPISPRSPGLQLSSLVLAMRSRDSLSYVSSLNQTFYALKRPRLILLYLYFHDCFVLNARQ